MASEPGTRGSRPRAPAPNRRRRCRCRPPNNAAPPPGSPHALTLPLPQDAARRLAEACSAGAGLCCLQPGRRSVGRGTTAAPRPSSGGARPARHRRRGATQRAVRHSTRHRWICDVTPTGNQSRCALRRNRGLSCLPPPRCFSTVPKCNWEAACCCRAVSAAVLLCVLLACYGGLPFTCAGCLQPHAGDAEIEEAVASRLYRAELARAEAQAKLGEW